MRAAGWLLTSALAACVASPAGPYDLDPALACTVVVPLPSTVIPGEAPLLEFYNGLLQRLHDAYRGRRLDELQRLLAGYRRSGAPDWAQSSMDSFVTAALGLEFELHCDQHAQLLQVGAEVPIGGANRFELRLAPPAGHTVVLGRSDGELPCVIGLRLVIEDTLLDGATRQQTVTDSVRLQRDLELVPGSKPAVLPFEIGADASAAVRRRVQLTVSLRPGYVLVDGERAPIRATELASAELVQYPAGSEPIRRQPLQSLRNAMALGDAAHFPHVLLAAMFARPEDRAEIEQLLVSWVRLGSEDRAMVAMAGLAELSGEPIAVGDRQRWLQWWQEHR